MIQSQTTRKYAPKEKKQNIEGATQAGLDATPCSPDTHFMLIMTASSCARSGDMASAVDRDDNARRWFAINFVGYASRLIENAGCRWEWRIGKSSRVVDCTDRRSMSVLESES